MSLSSDARIVSVGPPATSRDSPPSPARYLKLSDELVIRAHSGGVGAFEELVRRGGPAIYRLLVRLLGDPSAAEDVTRESFVHAWRALPRFHRDARLSTWIYRIALNEGNRSLAHESRREHLPFDHVMHNVPDLDSECSYHGCMPSKALLRPAEVLAEARRIP